MLYRCELRVDVVDYLMWKKEVNLEILCYSNLVIHGSVKSLVKSPNGEIPYWSITGVYGSSTTEK